MDHEAGDGARDDARDSDEETPESIELPIDGVLDLHTFSPRDVRSLVPDYLDACLARGLLCVRIIHGKGTGVQRNIVHAALQCHPSVESFRTAAESEGGWGATVVQLHHNASDSP